MDIAGFQFRSKLGAVKCRQASLEASGSVRVGAHPDLDFLDEDNVLTSEGFDRFVSALGTISW